MANRFDIDDALVRKLAGLLDETGLTEIEYETGGRRIRVCREASAPVAAAVPVPAPAAPAAPGPAETPEAGGSAISAPMVGTVYLSPQPGAEPFVGPGDTVAEGQTVALIEAMKTFNPVRAPRAGTIRQILVRDTDPVEFGEELMTIV